MLSVVVPYHLNLNSSYFIENWLPNCTEIEVILVQDLHHETSNISIEFLVAKYPDINIIHLSGYFNGPGGARNAGIAIANSEYIAFWDIDDYPNVFNVIEMTKNVITAKCVAGVGYFLESEVNPQNSRLNNGFVYQSQNIFSLAINPGIWRWVFNKNAILANSFEDITMGEDQVFLQALNIFDHKILKYEDVVYTYIKGWPKQLTSLGGLQRDIGRAIKIMAKDSLKGRIRSKIFRTAMIVRLTGTLIKNLVNFRR